MRSFFSFDGNQNGFRYQKTINFPNSWTLATIFNTNFYSNQLLLSISNSAQIIFSIEIQNPHSFSIKIFNKTEIMSIPDQHESKWHQIFISVVKKKRICVLINPKEND
jgi:hypothetical protein